MVLVDFKQIIKLLLLLLFKIIYDKNIVKKIIPLLYYFHPKLLSLLDYSSIRIPDFPASILSFYRRHPVSVHFMYGSIGVKCLLVTV